MQKWFIALPLVLAGLVASTAWADSVEGSLTQVILAQPSDSQLQSPSAKTVRLGLKTVLVRLSGNVQIATLPAVQPLLNQASRFLRSYRVQQDNDQDPSWVLAFDGDALQKHLAQLGQSLWLGNRPAALLWVISQDSARVSDDVIRQVSDQVASARGVGLLPLEMDLQDSKALKIPASLSDSDPVWQQDMAYLKKRYHVPVVITVQVDQSRSSWASQWQVSFYDESFSWQFQGRQIDSLLSLGLNTVVDTMANRMSVLQQANMTPDILLEIHGINSLTSLNALLKTLKGMSVVNNVKVTQLMTDSVRLSISSTSSLDDLRWLLQQKGFALSGIQQQGMVDNSTPTLTMAWNNKQQSSA